MLIILINILFFSKSLLIYLFFQLYVHMLGISSKRFPKIQLSYLCFLTQFQHHRSNINKKIYINSNLLHCVNFS